jgi:phosphatidylserine/phosphatidylglycerophosphate/cardiolipin synthase-like enzyme
MRFKSAKSDGFQVFAVSGANTISFGIEAEEDARRGLLGFAVERIDPEENERYIMPGFKVFRSVIPNPTPDMAVSTWEHPVQSFVWDDFTAKPKHDYEYLFYPIRGVPKNLDRSAKPISIRVRTEPLFSSEEHDVFFNRGVASSQAYVRRFGNLRPDDQPTPQKRKEALEWLTRSLDEAIVRFIGKATPGDTLLCCFYEFRYRPVADALMKALQQKVDVRLIIDAKVNEHTDKKGVFHPSFPREDNLALLDAVGISRERVILREAKPDDIQHNKFMVLVKDGTEPTEVWTGSTNISLGGFSGQTNVGHWIRNQDVAKQFRRYWDLLSTDPGGRVDEDRTTVRTKNAALQTDVAALHPAPTAIDRIPQGVTAVFSPRAGLEVLDLYVRLVDSAQGSACITLAFGIGKPFKTELSDNTFQSPLVFLLLERRDRANPNSKTKFVPLTALNNVYQAWGSFLRDPVYQWARETNAKGLRLNTHVAYVHSKFLLMDPLGADPIIVTGSANFSAASTNSNDENMLLIRGDHRVADIYFTEFNRLFNHYYFRSVTEALKHAGKAQHQEASLFLAENDGWLEKYGPGKLRAKRLAMYTSMEGAKSG